MDVAVRKCAAKFVCVKTFSGEFVRHSLAYPSAEMVSGRCPLLREIFGRNDPPSFKNGDFHSIFARSDCIVTKRDNCLSRYGNL